MSEGDVEMKVSPATEQQDAKEPDAGAEEVKGDEVKQDSAPDEEVKTSDDAAAAEEGAAAGGAAKDHSDAPVDDSTMGREVKRGLWMPHSPPFYPPPAACAAYDLRNPTGASPRRRAAPSAHNFRCPTHLLTWVSRHAIRGSVRVMAVGQSQTSLGRVSRTP